MANEDTKDLEASRPQAMIQTERIIVPHNEGDDPELEPLFANHFEIIQVGSDFYLDIGIVKPADMIGLKEKLERSPNEAHTVKFHVLQRIAMTQDGLQRLRVGVETATRGSTLAGN